MGIRPVGQEEEDLHLPLVSLNHISFICSSVSRSVQFYQDVLGFILVKRPSSLDFEGAWLFNYGIGIHLLGCESDEGALNKKKKRIINPKDNHISFQCSDMALLMQKMDAMGIDYVTSSVEDDGIKVDQLFFHDPDGYMVEICNCNILPVLPLSAYCPLRSTSRYAGKEKSKSNSCGGKAEGEPGDRFVEGVMGTSF